MRRGFVENGDGTLLPGTGSGTPVRLARSRCRRRIRPPPGRWHLFDKSAQRIPRMEVGCLVLLEQELQACQHRVRNGLKLRPDDPLTRLSFRGPRKIPRPPTRRAGSGTDPSRRPTRSRESLSGTRETEPTWCRHPARIGEDGYHELSALLLGPFYRSSCRTRAARDWL